MHNLQTRKKNEKDTQWLQRKYMSMKKPKISSNNIISQFSIMSEKCIIRRPFSHQKKLKIVKV